MPTLQDYLLKKKQQQFDQEGNPIPLDVADIAAVSEQTKANAPSGISPTLQKYLSLSGEAAGQQQQGLDTLQNYIQDYQTRPQETDYSALASWVDSMAPGGKGDTYEMAKAMRPESPEQRAQKVMQLQGLLQQRRGDFTKTQLDSLNAHLKLESQDIQKESAMNLAREKFAQQQQLAEEKAMNAKEIAAQKLEQERLRTEAYKEQGAMKMDIAKMNLEASRAAKEASQERADTRQKMGLDQKRDFKIADQVMKLGKGLGVEIVESAANIKAVEDVIGFNLDAYEPKTGTVAGQKVNIPGASVPGIGRMYVPGSEGERLQNALTTIFNMKLKMLSGAAVSAQEYQRLKQSFAAGQFNTEEKMLGALKRAKEVIRKAALQSEKSYMPEAVQRFKEQGGALSDDLLGAGFTEPIETPPETKEWNGKMFEKKGSTWTEVVK